MVVWNDSGSWITLETNCFQILNPYSNIDRCKVIDWCLTEKAEHGERDF